MLFFSLAAKIAAAAKKKTPMHTTTELSENSHRGFEGLKAAVCLATMEAKSNNASDLQACLRQNRTGSRCSGKERDETGFDYFGARYFSGAMGRFTSPDPFNIILHAETGNQTVEYILHPQNWNRYTYTWNNPLKYIDPTGELVVLTNETEEGKRAALQRLKMMVGTTELDFDENGVLFYTGKGDVITALGEFGKMMNDKITIIEYKIAEEYTFLDEDGNEIKETTEEKNGGATVGWEQSLNGNLQIFVHPDSARLATNMGFDPLFYRIRSSNGGPLIFNNATVDAHEFGHAWGQYEHGKKIRKSDETNPYAVEWENRQRSSSKDSRINSNRRKRH
jgi:RHS repeat-associated protein